MSHIFWEVPGECPINAHTQAHLYATCVQLKATLWGNFSPAYRDILCVAALSLFLGNSQAFTFVSQDHT